MASSDLQNSAVVSSLEYLEDNKLYETEKPYHCSGFNVSGKAADIDTTNLRFQPIETTFHEIRGIKPYFTVEQDGFEVMTVPSKLISEGFKSDSITDYITETIDFLRTKFEAELCFCYSYRVPESIYQSLASTKYFSRSGTNKAQKKDRLSQAW